MPRQRRQYSASRSRRTSRQVNERMVGSHVARGQGTRVGRAGAHDSAYALAIARRARMRRFIVGLVAVLVVVGIAVGAGFLAFRGTVGGQLALRDSDAASELVAARSGEPSYILVSVELGEVAEPLDNGGPDVFLLARLDSEARSLALIDMPDGLQITTDNQTQSMAEVAASGDAALIKAASTYAKVDVSHFVKLEEGDLVGMVDALGGVEVDVDQEIDDPRAGTVRLASGAQRLDGAQALVYLRATNLEYGRQDRLSHQLTFATRLIEQLFSNEGSFAARIESIDSYFQTDCSLADIEAIDSWLGGVKAGDIACAVVPGYYASNTNVSGDESMRYVGSAADMATLIDDLDQGRAPSVGVIGGGEVASPQDFTVDIENGTTVEGAASSAAALLKSQGFSVGTVGNAEQPVFEETLVVYKDGDVGLARARAVIDALGVGRPVEKNQYYFFEDDILLILGADNKPTS